MARKIGALDQPQLTGNLYTDQRRTATATTSWSARKCEVDEHGLRISRRRRQESRGSDTGRRPAGRRRQRADHPSTPFNGDAFHRVEKMDVNSGKRSARGALAGAQCRLPRPTTTASSASLTAVTWTTTTSCSTAPATTAQMVDWKINDELANGHDEIPLGFSADDRSPTCRSSRPGPGRDRRRWTSPTATRTQLFRDADSDPGSRSSTPATIARRAGRRRS